MPNKVGGFTVILPLFWTLADLPPASVMVGQSLAWLGLVVNHQQDTQDCCVGEVAQTLHGESEHHLHNTLAEACCSTCTNTHDMQICHCT